MKNKQSILFLAIAIMLVSSCKLNRSISINGELKACLSDKDINILLQDKQNKKGQTLFIRDVEFNFRECVGLFQYEYEAIKMSAGAPDYVLKGKEQLYFQSKNIKKNRRRLNTFMKLYGDNFSDTAKNYIEAMFIERGVTYGFPQISQ